MARRPQNIQADESIAPTLQRHIEALGLRDSLEYYEWCWNNGFEGHLRKSKTDLQDEQEAQGELNRKKTRQNRLHKKPKTFLEAICNGEINSDEIVRPKFRRVAEEIERSNEAPEARQSLLSTLTALLRHDDLVFDIAPSAGDIPFIRGLIKLHDRKALWLNPIEDWKPKSKNSLRKFGELTHYLFDEYGDIPRFMEGVWLRTDRPSWRYRDWYIHLGRGHNLRSAKSPVPITKKMAHHFLQAPDNYTVEQAIRWAQLKTLGASENTIHAIAATPLGRSFENEPFWFSVLRFIADAPMLDPRQIGPIIDYLQNQKYEMTEVELTPGEWRREPPPQPGLSMSGRNVATLLHHVENWHQALSKQKALPTTAYARSQFEGYSVDKKSSSGDTRWVIRQLMSGRDLQRESEELRHCVASYHRSCSQGNCTIWSLAKSTDGKTYERRQTIEIDKSGHLVQCRGLANSDPTSEEWSIVNSWASRENIAVATYL